MKILFYFTIVIWLFSCTGKKNIISSYDKYIIGNAILETDSTLLRNTSKLFTYNSIMYISVLNKNANLFEVFDLKTFEKLISKEVFFSDIIDYDIHNFDTIYLLRKKNIITLSDTSFNSIKDFKINSNSKYYKNNYHLFAAFSSPFVVKNDIAYVIHLTTLPIMSKNEFQESQKNKNEIHILLKDSMRIIGYAGNMPNDYQKKLFNDKIPFRTFKNNIKIYSFCYSDSVRLSNNQTFELKSNYFDIKSEFNFELRAELNETMRFHVENPAYNLLLYDKYKNQYYRVCKHSINYENRDGTINFIDDSPWSLIVADSNFNIKKEILFPPSYSRHDIFVTPAGVLVKKFNSYKYENKKIEFDIFSF